MNRLIMSIAFLSSIFSLTAMENSMSLNISKRENREFIGFLDQIVCANQEMILKKDISAKNSLHCILHKLSEDLVKYDKDLSKVIQSQELESRLFVYQAIELDDYVSMYRDQTILKAARYEDKNTVYKELIKLRYIIAGSKLSQLQPKYFFENSDQTQVDFMNNNELYPMDENAQKDYMALVIYQLALAPRLKLSVARR